MSANSGKMTILVIDDDEIFRGAMRHQLTDLGYRVIEAESGVGGRALVESDKPELCLIDLIMAEREGVETIIDLHSMENPPKLIATSSNPTYLAVTTLLGADTVLTKPITREMLQSTLQMLLPT